MTSRSRLLASTIVTVVALPSLARAQEPQPWTNTGSIGSRVVPALPAREVESTVVRGELGGGSTGAFKLTENRNDPGGGPSTKASFFGGRSGLSYGWESFDVFLTSYAYRVTIPKLAKNPQSGPLAVNPYTQSGDVALGARWVKPLKDGLNAGVEGGAVLLGGTGDPGDTGVVFAGPNTSATSPFVRGLFTWQGLGKGSERPLTVSANLGVFADRSWNVWKEAAEGQDGAEETPLEEERIAMSFYGDDGTATRILFGASAAYKVGDIAQPYLELSGESTSPDLTMRLTPGVAIHPLGPKPVALFVSADLDLSGDPKVSPRAPALRVNAGLQFAFGTKPVSDRPPPTPQPPRSKPYLISIRVLDELRQPVVGARVWVTAADGSELGEPGTTGRDGAVGVNTPPGTQTTNVTIHAKHPDYIEWQPVTHPARATPGPTVTLYKQRTALNIQYVNTNTGREWNAPAPPNVRVLVTPTEPARAGREFLGPVEVPASDGFRKLTISISILDWTSRPIGAVNDLQPGRTLIVYVDPEKKCADFNPEKCPPEKAPTGPTGFIDRFGFNVFEGDSVDVKNEEALKLLAKLQPLLATKPPQAHRIIVQAKKGDPLFQAAMAQARLGALLTWLNGTQKVPVNLVKVETNHEATSDAVILEVPK